MADPAKEQKQAARVREGAILDMALKQPGGREVLECMVEELARRIDILLVEKRPELELMAILYEARGLMQVLRTLGDKIKEANQLAVRRSVNRTLGHTRVEEDEV